MTTINTRKAIMKMEVERAQSSKTHRSKVEKAEKFRNIIEKFPDDFSWYVASWSPYDIHLYTYCSSDQDVKELCRITRSILELRTSIKKLDTSTGKIRYEHHIPGLHVDIQGGDIPLGCILTPIVTYEPGHSTTKYKIDCESVGSRSK